MGDNTTGRCRRCPCPACTVHALLALSGGGRQSAVGIENGLLEKTGGLMFPDADADVVIEVLQDVDVVGIEASAKIARGRGIGNASCAEGVEIIDIGASQFEVLETVAATSASIVADWNLAA